MKHKLLYALLGAWLPAAALAQTAPSAQATFHNAQREEVGRATLTQTSAGVLIDVRLTGIPPGPHAFHVHETGKCDAPDFESAGDHFAPHGRKHGFLVADGPHAGDIPNQTAQPDGTLAFEVLAAGISLSPGDASVFDGDGSALVLHAKPDDNRSQPSGDAGDRMACAVIDRTGGSK